MNILKQVAILALVFALIFTTGCSGGMAAKSNSQAPSSNHLASTAWDDGEDYDNWD